MNTFFRYYRQTLRMIGAILCLFLLFYSLFAFFFGVEGEKSILRRLITGTPPDVEKQLCLEEPSVPAPSALPLTLSDLID